MADTENMTYQILVNIQNEQTNIRRDISELKNDTHLRLSAIEDLLVGELSQRLAQRDKLSNLEKRVEQVENQLRLNHT